jgi:cytochrome oxidase Cu insertion factor (SCO1/SenC/PrrC family)
MRILRIALPVLGLVLAASAALLWQGYSLPKPQKEMALGQPAPAFTLPDQDGNPLSLADLRGAPVVLIFYRAHW